jgi:hypothetical protein
MFRQIFAHRVAIGRGRHGEHALGPPMRPRKLAVLRGKMVPRAVANSPRSDETNEYHDQRPQQHARDHNEQQRFPAAPPVGRFARCRRTRWMFGHGTFGHGAERDARVLTIDLAGNSGFFASQLKRDRAAIAARISRSIMVGPPLCAVPARRRE